MKTHSNKPSASASGAGQWVSQGLLLFARAGCWLARAHPRREVCWQGATGSLVRSWRWAEPERLPWLARCLGAASYPALADIAEGRLAWFGPRPRDPSEPPAAVAARPGLISSQRIRLQMGVAYTAEHQADREDALRASPRYHLGLLLRMLVALLIGRPLGQSPVRWPLLGLLIDNVDRSGALQRIGAMLDSTRRGWRVAFVNPHCANVAQQDVAYRHALRSAHLLLPDGSGLLLASRLLRTPLRENVNGTDFFPMLCAELERRGQSLFLLGAAPGVADAVADYVRQHYPRLALAGTQHGYFSAEETPAVLQRIHRCQPDVLLVAMGVPRQENWAAEYAQQSGAKIVMGVGGLFDFYSGRISRAPRWLQEVGCEWVWRLLQEPGRMWRRYLCGNLLFVWRVLLQRWGMQQPLPQLAQPEPAQRSAGAARTRAILLATPQADQDAWHGFPVAPALLPLGQRSLLEHTIEILVERGVRQVDVYLHEHYNAIAALLGHGERWGIHLQIHWLRDEDAILPRLRQLPADVDYWLVQLGCLLQEEYLSDLRDYSCSWWRNQAEGACWGGWAHVGRRDWSKLLTQVRHWSDLPKWLPGPHLEESLLSVATPLHLLQAQDLWLGRAPQLAPEWREMSPGIWAAADVQVEPGARLIAPVWLGRGTLIRAGAQIGPNVVTGERCVVDHAASVRNSLLLAHTFVGRDVSLDEALTDGRCLLAVANASLLQFSPKDDLLAQLGQPAARTAWRDRLLGLLLAALLDLCKPWLSHPAAEAQYLLRQVRPRLSQVWRGNLALVGLSQPAFRYPQARLGALPYHLLLAEQGNGALPLAESQWLADVYGACSPQRVRLTDLLRMVWRHTRPAARGLMFHK